MIPYIGGKSYLSKWIIENFPEDFREKTYVEVFGGGGWVLYKKDHSFLEVYNDKNSDLVNLFRVIRDNFAEFQHRMEWTLHSREVYAEAKERLKNEDYVSNIERAMLYATNRIQSFSGSGGWGYQVKATKITSGKLLPFLKRLGTINVRLKKVQIEHLDFEELIKKYDSKDTLFYIDPPYVDCEQYYKTSEVDFKREDHIRLNKALKKIKGRFILSYYDHPVVNELYSKFRILRKDSVKHSCGAVLENRTGFTKPKSIELLIMNY